MCRFIQRIVRVVTLGAAVLGVSGCLWSERTPSPAQQLGMKEDDYRKLEQKALAGSAGAAEKLAKRWYMYSSDNACAMYWLEVAARNGSKRAAKMLPQAKSLLAD